MLTIVITGSRNWEDRPVIEQALRGADCLIVGDCPTGADALALDVARAWDIVPVVLAADWQGLGKKVGPVRNQAIADRAVHARQDGLDVRCYAFPLGESRGTHDCRQRLEKAGFRVAVIEPVLW